MTDVLAGISTELLEQVPCASCGSLVWAHPGSLKPKHTACDREAREQDLMDSIVAHKRAARASFNDPELVDWNGSWDRD